MEKTRITITATVQKPSKQVWDCWTLPEHITQWNQASPDWHTPRAEADVREGGRFSSRMEAKDGSMGFDFWGTYTKVEPYTTLDSLLGDGRTVQVTFTDGGLQTHVTETFEAEGENSIELQRSGWQAILDCFKRYVEALP